MKPRLLLLCALLTACSWHGDPPVAVPVAVPLADVPAAERVDLNGAANLAEAAHESNRQIAGQLQTVEQANYEARRRLALLEQQKRISEQDYRVMEDAHIRTKSALDQSYEVVKDQSRQLSQLKGELIQAGNRVEAGELEKKALRSQIDTAKAQVATFVEANKVLQNQRDASNAKAAAAEGQVVIERKWKWRFFWWGTVASLLIMLYGLLRVYMPRLP